VRKVSYIKELQNLNFYRVYLLGLIGIFISLSISGFAQAQFLDLGITSLWLIRTLSGIVTLSSLIFFVRFKYTFTALQKYNFIGILTDGFGGIGLIFIASYLYPLVGFEFSGKYEYIVFAFVSMTGFIHFMALRYKKHEIILTKLTVFIRICIGSIFFTLFTNSSLGLESLAICIFDLSFVFIYLLFFYKKELLCKI